MLTVIKHTLIESIHKRMALALMVISVLIFAFMMFIFSFKTQPNGSVLVFARGGPSSVPAGIFVRDIFQSALGTTSGLWTFLGIFALAPLLSSYLENGMAGLLFTKALARWQIFLGRVAGAFVVFMATVVLLDGIPAFYFWARTGISAKNFLLAVGILKVSFTSLVAIMAQGLGYHRQVEADFRRIATDNGSDAKIMTSAGALIYGLHKLGAKKISLMAPYMKPLTDKVVTYIESEGIEVVDRICFEIPDNLEVGRRDPMRLLEDVRKLKTTNVDVVVLSACVQMQSIPALQLAQDALGIPVTSTSACTVRNMLDLLGLQAATPGFGKVLTH